MFGDLSRFCKGLSETTAIAILLGLAVTLATSFIIYIQTDYSTRQDLMLLRRIIESEKMNTVVRLITLESSRPQKDTHVMLLRRLDGGNRVYIFLYNGSNYVSCRGVIKDIAGGRIVGTYNHVLSELMVVSGGSIYSFKHYAGAYGYPDTGNVEVCAIEIDRNAIIKLSFTKELEPIVRGNNLTIVTASSRNWRLYGLIEFRVAYLGNPGGAHLYVNNTWYQLRINDVVRIDIDADTGKLYLTQEQLPNGEIGAQILAFNVFAKEVRINNAVLARYTEVRIASDVAIDIRSLKSSLTIEISPAPPGFTRVEYGGRTIIDYWNNSDYIRIESWKLGLDSSTPQLILQLEFNTLYAEGVAEAIYIGEGAVLSGPIDMFSVFTVTYINNMPYLVNIYDYRLS